MAKRNATADDITEDRPIKKIKSDVNIDADLQYIYDFERDDTSTRDLVISAQRLVAPYAGDKWNFKFNLPEPKEVQEFASNIYDNYKETKSSKIKLKGCWKLLYRAQGSMFFSSSGDGFYGELYFNTENHYLLLAIKGTTITSPGDLFADIKNVVLNKKGGALNSAITFGEKVRQMMLKFKCNPMLIITGHSLGGYLAQIITFTITYFFKGEDGSVQTREHPSDDFGIYTMVFDSPAALSQMCSIDPSDILAMKRFDLPITNFVKDTNKINSNKWIGKHSGQVLAISGFENLDQPGFLGKIASFNPIRSHAISNFDQVNVQLSKKVIHLKNKETVTYNIKKISAAFFSPKEFDLLHKFLILAPMCAELLEKLPTFTLANSCLTLADENISAEEFIPRAHLFLSQYRDQLDSGKFDGKQIIDMAVFNLWRAEMLEDAHELCLNEEWKQRVEQWPDGTKIGGFESHEEMRFIGCLLHNTVPKCFHYDYHKFLTLDEKQVRNFATTTKVALVLIVKEKNQIIHHKKYKEVKIMYLMLDSGEDVTMDNLVHSALDENSQEKLKFTELDFMGNDVTSKDVIGDNLFENLQIWSIYSMKVKSPLTDELFYCDQKIASADGESKFKSATEFALKLSKGEPKFVLISSDSGMGKSTALKQIAKTMQNQLTNYWIVHLNLFDIQNELHEEKGILNTKAEAIECLRNAALSEQKEDEVLKKVFDWKVEAQEMVLCLDSLDEICPFYRETAVNLLALLKETGILIVVTTRPQEGRNFKEAQIFSVEPIKCEDRDKFVSQKCHMMGKLPPLPPFDIEHWFKKKYDTRNNDSFWSVPLILNMAINIYDPTEDIKVVSDKTQKTSIFDTFFIKSISSTLEIKMNLHKFLASGCYAEKFDQYSNLIHILAICTIFHSGNITREFEQIIEDNWIFINRFDLAKVYDCHKVAFLHWSFAEYLIAKLFVQNQQANSRKHFLLDENQLKSILFDEAFSETRKHICTILAVSPTKFTSFSGCIMNGDKLLLSVLIDEDRYELYLAFKDLLSSQLNKTIRWNRTDVDTTPLYCALNGARHEFVQQLFSDGAQFEAILFEENVLYLAIKKGLYNEVIYHFDSLKSKINEKNSWCSGPITPQTALQIAAKNGSREMVEFLIEKGADVNYGPYFTALYFAIHANSAEIVELLIAKKANSAKALNWAAELNRKEIFDIIYEKYTPRESKVHTLHRSFFFAIGSGKLEIVKHLCDLPELDPRGVFKDGNTYLHKAASCDNIDCDMMDFIFEYQHQSIDVRNAAGETPLMKAIDCNEFPVKTVEWLLGKKADVTAVDNEGKSCLHFAAHNLCEETVEMLLKSGADINLEDKKGWKPFVYTFADYENHNSDVDMLKYFFENLPADANFRVNKGNTCLHIASKYGKVETVKLLVKHLSVNSENDDGQTPLHWAASKSQKDTVKFLLKSGADINLKDKRGWTSLFCALCNEKYGSKADLVKYLLENTSADVNLRSNKGSTCLHIASQFGNLEAVKLLLNHKLLVNCVNDYGQTPLHLAASMGQKDTVEFLLKSGADINLKDKIGWTPLFYASWNEKYGSKADLLKFLLENASADVNLRSNEGSTCLHFASQYGNLEAVKLLVNHKLLVNCVNDYGQTPLHLAALTGQKDTVELLLKSGADINLKDKLGRTPLFCASFNEIYGSKADLVKYLLENASADVNLRSNKGSTCLHIASQFGNLEAVKLLLNHKLLVNCVNDDGQTPLHLAALAGQKDTVELLLKSGADVNLKDKNGRTPLYCASFNEIYGSKADVVKYLLENASADVNLRSNKGSTCLHFASQCGNLEAVKLLLNHKLLVNCVNDDGQTPLHLAALAGQKDTVELLLKSGADINLKDKIGRTPLFYASCNENYESKADLVKYLLENASADVNLRSNDRSTCLHIQANVVI